MGKYPVISITLKDVEGLNFQTAYDMLGIVISSEARNFTFLLESDRLIQYEKDQLLCLLKGDFEKEAYIHNSLRFLTELLHKHYGIPAIVLIDEYDVPLDKAYQNGYYLQMVTLIHSLLGLIISKSDRYLTYVLRSILDLQRMKSKHCFAIIIWMTNSKH